MEKSAFDVRICAMPCRSSDLRVRKCASVRPCLPAFAPGAPPSQVTPVAGFRLWSAQLRAYSGGCRSGISPDSLVHLCGHALGAALRASCFDKPDWLTDSGRQSLKTRCALPRHVSAWGASVHDALAGRTSRYPAQVSKIPECAALWRTAKTQVMIRGPTACIPWSKAQ